MQTRTQASAKEGRGTTKTDKHICQFTYYESASGRRNEVVAKGYSSSISFFEMDKDGSCNQDINIIPGCEEDESESMLRVYGSKKGMKIHVTLHFFKKKIFLFRLCY